MVILARFWSGDYGQILPGSITSDLSEPYGNSGCVTKAKSCLVASLASDLSEPYGNLGKIMVRSPWPNLAW